MSTVILEVALLKVREGMGEEFEITFKQASPIICSMKGYLSHELHKCVEVPAQYILLVRWETIEDHTIGFRQSEKFQEWKQLLHHFYEPSPKIAHYYQL